jgi:integrase
VTRATARAARRWGHAGASCTEWYEVITTWLAVLAAGGTPPTTIRLRRQHLTQAAAALPSRPWETSARELVDYFAAQSWAHETRHSHRTTMRGLYRWALTEGFVVSSPADALPRVPRTPPAPRPLPEDALARVLASCDPRTALMVRLAGGLGLRRAEVARVHSEDLRRDLVGWSLLVHGKGSKDRLVPLGAPLAAAIRDAHGWCFPGRDGGHLSPAWVGTLVRRAMPDGWSMHTLRHRFATAAYSVDGDLLSVQQLLGHSSPATTQRYVLVPDQARRRLVEAVAA